MWIRRMRRVLWWLWLTRCGAMIHGLSSGRRWNHSCRRGHSCLLCGGRCYIYYRWTGPEGWACFVICGKVQYEGRVLAQWRIPTVFSSWACLCHYWYRNLHLRRNPVNNPESSKEVLFLNAVKGFAWQKRSNMSIARFGHQMATVRGRIYTFLGMYEPFCDIERYSPEQDLWTRLKPLLNDRFCYGLTATGGRRVLMFGGRKWQEGQEVCTTNVLEYDTEYDAWREVCKLPRPLCGIQCAIMTLQDPPDT